MFRLNTASSKKDTSRRVTETCIPARRNRKRRGATNASPEAVRTTWF